MKSLKVALWIAAIGCLAYVQFLVLPWFLIESIALWFGVDPIPNVPVAMYFFRVACGMFGLIGIYFIILARNPLSYGPMLGLGAYGLIVYGLLVFIVGFKIGIPPIVYIGDALFGVILGTIITILSSKAKRALNKSDLPPL
jgi:hypothetical protein